MAQTENTDSLLALHRRQITLSQQINDWNTHCASRQAVYDLLTDSLPAEAVPQLDSIIMLEDSLRHNETGRSILAVAFGNRYYWHEQEELNHKVVADCEKYLQYSNASIDSGYLPLVLKAAGIATSQIGDQRQSVAYLEKLLKWERQQADDEAIASASINLANSYNNTGQYDAALTTAREALALTVVSPERRSYLHAIQAQVYLALQDYDRAGAASQIAVTLLRPLTETEGYAERMQVLLKVNADVLAVQQRRAAALQACYESLNWLRQARPNLQGRDAGKTCIAMARLYRSGGSADSALKYCNLAIRSVCGSVTGEGVMLLPNANSLHPENTIMEALDEKAQLLELMHAARPDTTLLITALQCYSGAFEVESKLRRFFIYDNSKYLLAAGGKARSGAAIRVCLALERQTKRPYWAAQAFDFAEKSKAGALLDKVRENLLAGAVNDTAFVKAGQMQMRAARLDEQISALPADSAAAARRAILEMERDAYLQLLAQYKTDMNTRLSRLYDDAGRDYTAADIAKALQGKTDAVLEFFSGDSLLYVFLLNPATERVHYTSAPLRETENSINRLLPFLNSPDAYNNNPDEYAKLAGGLYEQMLRPLLAAGPYPRVTVIPDGLAGQLPLAALQTGGTNQFLLEKHIFNYAFSCASLLQQTGLPRARHRPETVFFAPFMQAGLRGLPALPQSVKEQEAIDRFSAGGGQLLNGQALKQRFLEQAPRAGLLHIASHAYAADSAEPRIEFADSSLPLSDVYGLRLNNQLVVLSACHTGAGNVQQSEGVLSLARGFYYAGARNVINSLWEANDRSAGQLFENFYSRLRAGGNTGMALRESQLQYLKTAAVEKRSPYYWASFVSIGDGEYRLPVKNKNWVIWIIAAGVLAVLTAVVRLRITTVKRKGRQQYGR